MKSAMNKGRLEAFSDGVIAIIITIMALELKTPQGTTLAALRPMAPALLSYLLSFVYVGIYWNNHHHMLHASCRINGVTLWANLHLLFWLSLFPFGTAWMGQNPHAIAPAATYGCILLMAAIAYFILQSCIIAAEGEHSLLKTAIGSDWKGKLSPVLYACGIATSFWHPALAQSIYALVALIWLVPDRRIERALWLQD